MVFNFFKLAGPSLKMKSSIPILFLSLQVTCMPGGFSEQEGRGKGTSEREKAELDVAALQRKARNLSCLVWCGAQTRLSLNNSSAPFLNSENINFFISTLALK